MEKANPREITEEEITSVLITYGCIESDAQLFAKRFFDGMQEFLGGSIEHRNYENYDRYRRLLDLVIRTRCPSEATYPTMYILSMLFLFGYFFYDLGNRTFLELPKGFDPLMYINAYHCNKKPTKWIPPTKDEMNLLCEIFRIIHTLNCNSPGIFGKSEDIGNILSIFVLKGIAGNGAIKRYATEMVHGIYQKKFNPRKKKGSSADNSSFSSSSSSFSSSFSSGGDGIERSSISSGGGGGGGGGGGCSSGGVECSSNILKRKFDREQSPRIDECIKILSGMRPSSNLSLEEIALECLTNMSSRDCSDICLFEKNSILCKFCGIRILFETRLLEEDPDTKDSIWDVSEIGHMCSKIAKR